MSTNPRYDGLPLLRLLELYVLSAIGELSQESEDDLKRMAPKLQSIYGGDGQWHDAIARSMHMPEEMPAAIRDMWVRNLEIARVNDVTLSPQKLPRCSWTTISEIECSSLKLRLNLLKTEQATSSKVIRSRVVAPS
ncbi:hypothetical protein [Mesorhizobium sp. M0488]|uniref:hypothetical protein n=1 Tax=unclassified Mesorhizobium TaxID=325217 RepID=UPI00333AA3F4